MLENSYLCGISNNVYQQQASCRKVVICLKIRTFVVSATTINFTCRCIFMLWFAWKFVPLWYQQQLSFSFKFINNCCDLLENSYLCGISNNLVANGNYGVVVVICLKLRTFVVSATTACFSLTFALRCDLLENSYLCGISNNVVTLAVRWICVVICLKIRTFVVSATTAYPAFFRKFCCDLLENSYLCGISNNALNNYGSKMGLWFAWKFVPLWYQQQHYKGHPFEHLVVICLKIRTFVVSATTFCEQIPEDDKLWFAWKFVPLWYQQQLLANNNQF